MTELDRPSSDWEHIMQELEQSFEEVHGFSPIKIGMIPTSAETRTVLSELVVETGETNG